MSSPLPLVLILPVLGLAFVVPDGSAASPGSPATAPAAVATARVEPMAPVTPSAAAK